MNTRKRNGKRKKVRRIVDQDRQTKTTNPDIQATSQNRTDTRNRQTNTHIPTQKDQG